MPEEGSYARRWEDYWRQQARLHRQELRRIEQAWRELHRIKIANTVSILLSGFGIFWGVVQIVTWDDPYHDLIAVVGWVNLGFIVLSRIIVEILWRRYRHRHPQSSIPREEF